MRRRQATVPAGLAYSGSKYKKPEFTPLFLATETAIYETFVVGHRTLTDRTVARALTRLVEQLRAGPLPAFDPDAQPVLVAGQEEDFLVWNIRNHWTELFERSGRPLPETLIGILRTLLGSIEVWTSPSPTSRGYLNYIEGFLNRGGIRAMVVEEGELLPEPEDEFLAAGRQWCEEGDEQAHADFLAMADELVRRGERDRVVETAQRLLATTPPPAILQELSRLSIQAQQAVELPALPDRREGHSLEGPPQ
jgi:hypothetical protein